LGLIALTKIARLNCPSFGEYYIESAFIGELDKLKYTPRPDIRGRAALEANFRIKFEALNRVTLSDAEFSRLRDEIVNPDVFQALFKVT
jgi:type I restriction enzyme R subunit